MQFLLVALFILGAPDETIRYSIRNMLRDPGNALCIRYILLQLSKPTVWPRRLPEWMQVRSAQRRHYNVRRGTVMVNDLDNFTFNSYEEKEELKILVKDWQAEGRLYSFSCHDQCKEGMSVDHSRDLDFDIVG